MTLGLTSLSTASLTGLAAVLETGGLRLPVGAVAVGRYVSQREVESAVTALGHLADSGLNGPQVAQVLRLLAAEREQGQRFRDRLELVWSGPELVGSGSRDTAIVVRELFASAERSVLLSSFAVYQGQQVFEVLARRMEEKPDLAVRFFLNIARPHQDQRSDSGIIKDFAESFSRDQWPGGARLPTLYYDSRALSAEAGPRAVLHAKCIIVDDHRAFVTSANFTEAAQERNIEAGILIEDRPFAASLRSQFDALLHAGVLKQIPL